MSKAQGKQDDEDLYSGYHDLNANTEVIMKTVAATSKASESDPLAALRPPTGSQAGGPGAVPAGGPEQPRPMTSVRAAGYSSAGKRPGDAKVFDPLKQQSGPAPPLQQRSADSPEFQARDMEKAVNRLIEESAAANVAEQYSLALEKAKEAGKRERALCKHREKNGLADQINVELTYAVCFNLANQYHANGMLTEALNTYSVVVKNKQYPQAARLRVNMGNIYYQQKKYPMAIKMYRMAMDQMAGNNNASSRDMRFKIMRNIGDSFVRLGQFQDAIHHFEAIMDGTGVTAQNAQAHAAAQAALGGNAGPGMAADAQTGFNLIVCYYAVGDKEKMKRSFQLLLSVPEFHDEDDDDDDDDHRPDRKKQKASDDIHIPAPPAGPVSSNPNAPTNAAAARTAAAIAAAAETVDELRAERTARKKRLHRYVLMAAKLVAPVIERDGPTGFDWTIEALKNPPKPGGRAGAPKPVSAAAQAGAKSTFASIAMELEIAKGIAFLKRKEISAAIDVFKGFERKDNSAQLIDQAATNLSFLYFLEGDHKNAEKYAEMAVKADRYNAKALVNKANYIFARADQHSLEAAKELYLEAIGVEADCVEAIYNLGLTNKRLGHLEDALQAFKKLHRIIPKDPQVVYQIANLLELMDDAAQAAEWFKVLHGAVPTDPKVLYRLGMLYNKEDDETQASHNFIESYQHYPVNMEVISWLGIWYVKSGNYEQAIQFFERAAEISPEDVKWKLMVASCYRRNDDIHKALHLYKQIHKQEPENIECLRYLCIICKDLNDPAWEDYNRALKKAEREQQKSNEKSGFMAGEVNPNGAAGEPPAGDLKMAPQLAGAGGAKLETPSTSPTGSRDGPRPSVGHGQLPSGEDRGGMEAAGGGAAAGRGAQQVDANSDFKTHLSPRSQGRTLQAKEKGDEDDPFDDGDLLP